MRPHIITTQAQLHWANLRHAAIGALFGVAITFFISTTADPEQTRISKLFFEVGEHICHNYGGLISITTLTQRRFRFECQENIVIEQDVVLK